MTTAQTRWLRILAAMGGREGPAPTPLGMCSAGADLLGAGGVGVFVMAKGVPGATFASNPLAASLEELQFTLGAGPGVDAHTVGIPISECDLDMAMERWPGFCGLAVAAGSRAAFSFPLRLGAARLGALSVYQLGAGPLDEEVYADALVLADVVTRGLLAGHATVPAGSWAVGLGDDGTFDPTVHQASGMVSVQLEVGVGEALARLRARAFADDTPVTTIAADVIARRLRFEER